MRPLLPMWAAVVASAVGGIVLDLSFPSVGWWPLAFVGVALALVGLIGRRVGGAILVGTVFGAAFFLVHVIWTSRYLGPVPWLALSLFEAALMGLGAIPIALAYRWLPRLLPRTWARLIGLPVLVAGLWTMRELWLGTWPYTGFPWGRIGMSQSESPLASLTSWVGVSGLTFLMVLLVAAAIELVRVGRFRDVRAYVPSAIVVALLLLVPQFPTTPAGDMRVGAVQGNGPTGYFDTRPPDSVLDSQLEASAPLIGEDVDVVLWPEGGVDSDPLRDAGTGAVLTSLAERVGAPLIINAVTERGRNIYNTSMLWVAGKGAVALHDKTHPVPFGEFVPDRWFYRLFAPDLIDLIGREYSPGTNPPLFRVDDVVVGLAICFDVIYDDVLWTGAREGAQVYMFQTNNADFRGTDENLQQLAFARIRAIETGRSVVNISTVGTSQVIAPDGRVLDALPADEAGAILADVPLRTGLTPAVIIGQAVQLVLGWGSLLAIIAMGVGIRLRRQGTTKTPAPVGTGVGRER
jgi:apolipoprotein N-acyltransferase